MQSQKLESPISLKVSYKNQLQLKLSIPQKFQIQKFARHWVVINGFYEFQQLQIVKRYFSYLNEGDLIKFQGRFSKMSWKEKIDKKNQSIDDPEGTSFSNLLKVTQNSKSYANREVNDKKILSILQKFYQEDATNQMDGLKVITLFLNLDSDDKFISKLLNAIKTINNPNILVNVFIKDPFVINNPQFSSINKWVVFNSMANFQGQIKLFFYKLSKITVKTVSMSLTCFDGEMVRRNAVNQSKTSEWILQQNTLTFSLNFPQCNKVYINSIQFRNVGYQQCYKFELSLNFIDINERSFHSTKSFQLKPQREQFQSIRSPDYHAQNQKTIKNVVKIEQSLRYDSVELFQKMENLKHVCQRIQIQIKNNGNFVNNSDDDDRVKMLHSFEI